MSEPIHLLSRSTIGLVGLFKQLTPFAVIRQQQLRTRRRTLLHCFCELCFYFYCCLMAFQKAKLAELHGRVHLTDLGATSSNLTRYDLPVHIW